MTSPTDNTPVLEAGLRKYMVLILSYVDSMNTRTISMQKELNRLKYLLELKKAKRLNLGGGCCGIDIGEFEAEKKRFETKRKMYVGKLNKQEIKAPKIETLQYYNIKFDEEMNTYNILD